MSAIDDSRTIGYGGVRFRTVGKGILHCQLCNKVTHDYVSHANWHVAGYGDEGY